MAHLALRFGTRDPLTCAVCRRRAGPSGYTERPAVKIIWLCEEPACLALGEVVWHMPSERFEPVEIEARNDAADAGGAYLEQLGRTDLATLSVDEYRELVRVVIVAFGDAMRARLEAAGWRA